MFVPSGVLWKVSTSAPSSRRIHGRRFVGRAVGHIDGDAQLVERQLARETRLGEFDVAAQGIVDALRAADLAGRRPDVFDLAAENEVFDLPLDPVVQLVAVVAEKLDPVVLVGVMRSGQHDPGVAAQRTGDVRHAGRRQGAELEHVHAQGHQSGRERVFEHVAALAGVLAQGDGRAEDWPDPARVRTA